jgi:hypothetical protein
MVVDGWARARVDADYPIGLSDAEPSRRGVPDMTWGQGLLLDAFAPSMRAVPGLRESWARYERFSASPGVSRAMVENLLNIDVRHVLQFDYIYQIPASSKLPAALFKGWQINGLTQMRSGLSVNVTCGCDSMQIGSASARANAAGAPPSDSAVQRSALLNRLDVRAKLYEYAAADAAVKLEIARQYPSVTLSPGYIWDQGDNIWSLVATVLVPAAGNKPAIQAALARRDAAAHEFLAMQGKVISEADAAQARYLKTMESAVALQQMVDLQSVRGKEAKKQFDAGRADRVELALAMLETWAVERRALATRLETQRALGALEDALQMPLEGAPLPNWVIETTQAQTAPPGLARQ